MKFERRDWQFDAGLFCFFPDLEHKPDIVWPHSEQVIISTVSECGSFMAMGLKTGTVVVWDVYRGES